MLVANERFERKVLGSKLLAAYEGMGLLLEGPLVVIGAVDKPDAPNVFSAPRAFVSFDEMLEEIYLFYADAVLKEVCIVHTYETVWPWLEFGLVRSGEATRVRVICSFLREGEDA